MASEIMDEAKKRKLRNLSFIPVLAFLIATTYHLVAFRDEVVQQDMDNHIALTTETVRHWTPLMILYGLASLLSLAMLLYFIVHLLRLKNMNAASKIGWVAFLTFLAPISFPFFWYMQIRNEPKRLETYPNI